MGGHDALQVILVIKDNPVLPVGTQDYSRTLTGAPEDVFPYQPGFVFHARIRPHQML